MKVKGIKTQPTLPSCRCYDLRLKSKQCGSKAHDFDHSFTLLSTAGLSGYTSSHFKDEETVIQSLSCVQLFLIPWTAAHQASLSFTSSWSLLKLMSIESVMASNHLILCHPILFLPVSSQFLTSLKSYLWDFPDGPAVKIWCFHFRGYSFHHWSGIEDPMCHTMRPKF